MDDLLNAPVATKPNPMTVMESTSIQREISEIQAMVMMAKKFPRDPIKATEKIMIECQRPSLAEAAVYSYARGGTSISGASIRLAETIARNWGNLEAGVKELSQQNGRSEMLSFCWDLESNSRVSKTFTVAHQRDTKKGSYQVTDGREIYEISSNFSARRLRACILASVPGDLVDAAVAECEKTLKATADLTPDGLKKLVTAFASFGVTKEQIEKRIQRRLDTVSAGQVVGLKKIYTSLRDGMSSPVDWFEADVQKETPKTTGTEAAKEALKSKAKDKPKEEQKSPPEGAQGARTTTARPLTDPLTCPADNEPRTVGWCVENCINNVDCPTWK